MKKVKSPLRYPGGKSRAVKIITNLIPEKEDILISPFFGGGSIELECAQNNKIVKGYDNFLPLTDFWEQLIKNNINLAKEIQKYYPLSKEDFYKLQKSQFNNLSKLERAAIFYVLNRSSFSGSTLSGGMSPNHPRFTTSSIQRIIDFKIKNLTVENKSFEDSIKENTGRFFYLDPPYIIKNYLYGNRGDNHKGFNHLLLKDILDNEEKWIMSYNNSEEVLDLYSSYYITYPDWKYGMSKNKDSKEVLIFSKAIEKILKKENKI